MRRRQRLSPAKKQEYNENRKKANSLLRPYGQSYTKKQLEVKPYVKRVKVGLTYRKIKIKGYKRRMREDE